MAAKKYGGRSRNDTHNVSRWLKLLLVGKQRTVLFCVGAVVMLVSRLWLLPVQIVDSVVLTVPSQDDEITTTLHHPSTIIQNKKHQLVLAHVVSPFVSSSEDLVQRITLKSMERAKAHTHNATVNLYCAIFPEDKSVVPTTFHALSYLNRSTQTVYPELPELKKLPFIDDILTRLYETAMDADYIIYTNIDIGVKERFYDALVQIIEQGHDAFTINRRTVESHFQGEQVTPEHLELAYQQEGKPHPGHDCFVFKRDLFQNFSLGSVFIGYPKMGNTLISFLEYFGDNYKKFTNEFLTFHIGEERTWLQPSDQPYRHLNIRNCEEALSKHGVPIWWWQPRTTAPGNNVSTS